MNGLQFLKEMSNSSNTTKVVRLGNPNKIDITKLTRADFKTPALRAKYFRANNLSLDRLHLPEMTAEVYNEVAKDFKGPKTAKANLSFDTASSYFIRKAQLRVLAEDLGVNPSTLDSSNYIWNEDYYIHPNFLVNLNIAEDLFRERGDDWREASANTVYIAKDAKNTSLDAELWENLYHFCFIAIVSRKAMLLHKVPQCLSFLMSILEYSNGFTENVTGAQLSVMRSYIEFFTNLLTDEEASSFIKSNTDVEVFGAYEATASDYVETYRTMLRQLVRCTGDELEYFRDIMSTVSDPNLEKILEQAMDPEDCLSGVYLDNEDDEDFEVEPEE